LGVLPLGLAACASLETNPNAIVIEEVNNPIAEVRAMLIKQLPVGLAWSSDNAREMKSKYFVPGPVNTYNPGSDANVRYQAKIILLGDMRPYQIEVLVTSERRVLRGNVFRYVSQRPDLRLTRQLSDRIRVELAKRRDDHNVIDDFRVY
jgi:hypothetical protein